MVHEDAGEAVAYGAADEHGGHGAVHAAREAEDDAVGAQLLAQFGNGGLDERGGAPFLTAAADVDDKVAQQLCALRRMEHFGVELHAPELFALSLEGGICDGRCRSYASEMVGEGSDGVAVAHPHL